ncbi:MAG: protein FxsA, partial [Actinomycetota bacterium]|nr:protein FxsA [Actinomycetota bacterium]
MVLFLFVILLVLPLAELWVLIQVADVIGLVPALLLLLGVSMAGAWLLKREGMATWRRLQETIQRGGVP